MKQDELIRVYEDTLRMISQKYSTYPQLVMLCNDVLEVGERMKEN